MFALNFSSFENISLASSFKLFHSGKWAAYYQEKERESWGNALSVKLNVGQHTSAETLFAPNSTVRRDRLRKKSGSHCSITLILLQDGVLVLN